jgi:beta-mannosidase
MDLAGTWRAAVATDELRRNAVGLEYDDASWHELTVPGHWRNTPAFAGNDSAILHRRAFTLPEPEEGRRHFVTLDGVFYQADVWLDGAYLGDPEGYFFPSTFDITDLARLTSEHVLAIEVACAPQRNAKAKRNITGVFQHWDCIPNDINPGGLWRTVRIETTGPVRLDRVRVLCRDANDVRAHLRLHARLDSDQQRTVTLRTIVDGTTLLEHDQPLARGINAVEWNLDVIDPSLWWPWSLGQQALTDVRIEVVADGVISDHREVRTGLREIAMSDWTFSVNGERLFIKGANLAPTTAYLADASAADVRRDVELAREAGLDLVRVHGHIARDELYDAADELGILVWQDFPLHRGYARSIRKEAVRQAGEAVNLLGHHPSIALWCAHNEPLAIEADRRQITKKATVEYLLGQQLPSWNKSILDSWVKRAFEAADETRPAIAHSGVMPHLPLLDGTDTHLYFGWYHGHERDLSGFAATVPRMVRFVSEFGAQAIPEAADFMEPERWPDLDWPYLTAEHGFQPHSFDRFVPPDEYATFDEWRTASQQYQATLVRHHIETLRRLKYRPTGGFCMFMLNDSLPMISWSVLDHERRPKAAYQAMIDACRPVIVVADRMPDTVRRGEAVALDVHVVSDLRRPLDDVECTAALRWPGGGHTWKWHGNVPADDCVRVGIVRFVVPDAPGELWLDLTIEHGDEVATNRYTSTVVV